MTTNRSFASWGQIVEDEVVATAILDRVLGNAVVLNIRGGSYRMRKHKKLSMKQERGGPPRDISRFLSQFLCSRVMRTRIAFTTSGANATFQALTMASASGLDFLPSRRGYDKLRRSGPYEIAYDIRPRVQFRSLLPPACALPDSLLVGIDWATKATLIKTASATYERSFFTTWMRPPPVFEASGAGAELSGPAR